MCSAPDILTFVFGHGDDVKPREFLQSSLAQPDGQFGYANHIVAISDSNIAGVYCRWHDKLPADFDRATVDSIHRFFGIEEAMNIMFRSRESTRFFTPPQAHQLCIGHLAVDMKYRGHGIARAMLADAIAFARQIAKTHVVLDVALNNQPAIGLYLANGFIRGASTDGYLRMIYVL